MNGICIVSQSRTPHCSFLNDNNIITFGIPNTVLLCEHYYSFIIISVTDYVPGKNKINAICSMKLKFMLYDARFLQAHVINSSHQIKTTACFTLQHIPRIIIKVNAYTRPHFKIRLLLSQRHVLQL